MEQYDQYLENNMNASIQELTTLAAQPSVSAQNWGLKDCAILVKSMLEKRGFKVELINQTTLLQSYLHYSKGELIKLCLSITIMTSNQWNHWTSGSHLLLNHKYGMANYSVGESMTIKATSSTACLPLMRSWPRMVCCRAILNGYWKGRKKPPAKHYMQVVRADPQKFNADACIWEFGGVDDKDRPMEYLGLRGICYVELSVETANQDVHSGLGGSIMPNAAWRLVWALDSLKGPDENIRIAGFYNKVKPVSAKTRILLEALPDEAEQLINQYGIKSFLKGIKGGAELRLAEAHEPTCTICGLNSGYQGEGAKTVQPARASAKVDFRLVPDQVPEEIFELLRAHLDRNGFEDVKIELLGKERPAVTDPEHPFVDLVVETAREVYGMPMQIVPSVGGSGPNSIFKEFLDFPIVSAGIGYPAMQAHAPNENVRLDLYLKGAKHIVRIIEAFASDEYLV